MSEPAPWSDAARDALYEIYRFWAQNRRPPNACDLHEATGLDPRQLRQAFRELQIGVALAFPENHQQLTIIKAPPFSAVPTAVSCWVNGQFQAYLGCPAEALTIAHLPMYEGVTLTIRSNCGCCFAPIELEVLEKDIVATAPSDILVSVATSPWEWGPGPIDRVCDAFYFVLNAAHAEELDRQIGRRGIVTTLAEIQGLGAGLAGRRMRDPSWGPVHLTPEVFIDQFEKLGVDIDVWR